MTCLLFCVQAVVPVPVTFKQGVALMGRNRTGPPCNVGHLTAHVAGPPAGSVTDDNRRQWAKHYWLVRQASNEALLCSVLFQPCANCTSFTRQMPEWWECSVWWMEVVDVDVVWRERLRTSASKKTLALAVAVAHSHDHAVAVEVAIVAATSAHTTGTLTDGLGERRHWLTGALT